MWELEFPLKTRWVAGPAALYDATNGAISAGDIVRIGS